MYFDHYGKEDLPVLVLLHGAAALDTFAGHYAALSEHFRVLVPHLPGAGQAAADSYEPQAVCDALAEWISSLGAGKVALMGHSVGAELAFKLVCEHESLFSRAVFLSPWLMAGAGSTKLYTAMARMTYKSIRNEKLIRMQAKYWNLSPEQADKMAAYSPKIPLDTYVSFFEKRIHFSDEPGYESVSLPMLAMCSKGDSAETKASIAALGENKNCLTVIFPLGSHDFVLRLAEKLSPMLLDFLLSQA
jgi:pimeloyl-ACP methyl ester carboxylesterase